MYTYKATMKSQTFVSSLLCSLSLTIEKDYLLSSMEMASMAIAIKYDNALFSSSRLLHRKFLFCVAIFERCTHKTSLFMWESKAFLEAYRNGLSFFCCELQGFSPLHVCGKSECKFNFTQAWLAKKSWKMKRLRLLLYE